MKSVAEDTRDTGAARCWLVLLALVNVAIYVALAAFPNSRGIRFLDSLGDGAQAGQLATLGILAALMPRRAVAGLAAIAILTLLSSSANWLLAIKPLPFLTAGIAPQALTTQAIFWGFRMLWHTRIAARPLHATHQSGQFQIIDLLESTALIAAALGALMIELPDRKLTVFAVLFTFVYFGVLAIAALPTLWVGLSRRLGALPITALLAWSIMTVTAGAYLQLAMQSVRLSTAPLFFLSHDCSVCNRHRRRLRSQRMAADSPRLPVEKPFPQKFAFRHPITGHPCASHLVWASDRSQTPCKAGP